MEPRIGGLEYGPVASPYKDPLAAGAGTEAPEPDQKAARKEATKR